MIKKVSLKGLSVLTKSLKFKTDLSLPEHIIKNECGVVEELIGEFRILHSDAETLLSRDLDPSLEYFIEIKDEV